MVDKKKVQEYLKKLQQVDKLKGEIEAIETGFMAHCTETGETVICNLLKVSISKNPPKLVTVTEGVTLAVEIVPDGVAMAEIPASFVKGTLYVKLLVVASFTVFASATLFGKFVLTVKVCVPAA